MVNLCSGVIRKILETNKRFPKKEWIAGLCETNGCVDLCTEPCVGTSRHCRLDVPMSEVDGTVHKHPGTREDTTYFSHADHVSQIVKYLNGMLNGKSPNTECVTGTGIVRCNSFKEFSDISNDLIDDITDLVDKYLKSMPKIGLSDFLFDNFETIERIHYLITEKETVCGVLRSGKIKCYEYLISEPRSGRKYDLDE